MSSGLDGVTNGCRDHTVHKGHAIITKPGSSAWGSISIGTDLALLVHIDHGHDIYSCAPPDGLMIMRN